jgi:hypothetical protein
LLRFLHALLRNEGGKQGGDGERSQNALHFATQKAGEQRIALFYRHAFVFLRSKKTKQGLLASLALRSKAFLLRLPP